MICQHFSILAGLSPATPILPVAAGLFFLKWLQGFSLRLSTVSRRVVQSALRE